MRTSEACRMACVQQVKNRPCGPYRAIGDYPRPAAPRRWNVNCPCFFWEDRPTVSSGRSRRIDAPTQIRPSDSATQAASVSP